MDDLVDLIIPKIPTIAGKDAETEVSEESDTGFICQAGSLKIGEIVRYTITYVPSEDCMPNLSSVLYLRIKNNSIAALRAAFIRGPYNLSVAAYPAAYNPNEEFKDADRLGVPCFEPNLRAGGTWDCILKIPEEILRKAGKQNSSSIAANEGGATIDRVSWIVEITSQVVFSTSAMVHYKVLLGRHQNFLSVDTMKVSKNTTARNNSVHGQNYADYHEAKNSNLKSHMKGVFTKVIEVKVEDTAMLWSKPSLSDNEDMTNQIPSKKKEKVVEDKHNGTEKTVHNVKKQRRSRKFHLVVLTHGLHSNIGADMLYLKESIDATVRQAKINARDSRRKMREGRKKSDKRNTHNPTEIEKDVNHKNFVRPSQQSEDKTDESEEEQEEVIVRGFSGNVARTERGIKYLGKRLARYVLSMTHPEQPFRPNTKRRISQTLSYTKKTEVAQDIKNIRNLNQAKTKRTYRFTSISFIGHSLGGLVQTYAIAYIQKYWPNFFDQIKPINFIALAAPFLGLSCENPTYIKFALDFGLVGRTGQDLGLTWSAPTIAKSGWEAIFGGSSENGSKIAGEGGHSSSEVKPLLQILPSSLAHSALKKFKSRTVYSNIVNDGIVPLRTSCLLFVDLQGLGKVEKSKRDSGLMGKFAEWSWAEITGATSSTPSPSMLNFSFNNSSETIEKREVHTSNLKPLSPLIKVPDNGNEEPSETGRLLTLMRRIQTSKSSNNFIPSPLTPKHPRGRRRSQASTSSNNTKTPSTSSLVTDSSELSCEPTTLFEPPRTSFFESAGDVLKPPLPTVEYLLNFSSRPQSIFHDRIYYPYDIPPPVQERRNSRRISLQFFHNSIDALSGSKDANVAKRTDSRKNSILDFSGYTNNSGMRVEEKIARAYHRDLSWRKVLVRLEPDAHNNIIVRRMFANAYGWPVVKHLCDTHFSESAICNAHQNNIWKFKDTSDDKIRIFVDDEFRQNRPDLDFDDFYDSDTESEDANEPGKVYKTKSSISI